MSGMPIGYLWLRGRWDDRVMGDRAVGRWDDRVMGRQSGVAVGRWDGGTVGRWGGGAAVGRQSGGAVGRWGDGAVGMVGGRSLQKGHSRDEWHKVFVAVTVTVERIAVAKGGGWNVGIS